VYRVLKIHQLENFRHHGTGGIVHEIAEHALDLSGGSSCEELLFSNVNAYNIGLVVATTTLGTSGDQSCQSVRDGCSDERTCRKVWILLVDELEYMLQHQEGASGNGTTGSVGFQGRRRLCGCQQTLSCSCTDKGLGGAYQRGACNNYCMEEEEPGVAYATSANLLEQALPILASLSSKCRRSWGVALVYVAADILHNRCISYRHVSSTYSETFLVVDSLR
jgi:hypothetical protein